MSIVTNVILTFSNLEEEKAEDEYVLMQDVDEWTITHCNSTLRDVDSCAGGTKHLEANVFVAAFNHLNVDGFVKFIKSLPWRYPNEVQLFIREQEEWIFTERIHKTPEQIAEIL